MDANHPVDFFDKQFQKQVSEQSFALNPFEAAVLPHLTGSVLDLGCGLGNLSVEAARRGASVVAVDASPTAVAHIQRVAEQEKLALQGVQADLGNYSIDGSFDSIAAIGLLMFFDRARALELLEEIQRHVKPGGCAVINVLIEGTTYLGMFQPDHYYLFGRDELMYLFAGWKVLELNYQSFSAPDNTEKVFATIVARKV
ncbi:class I SAM-dependent methyltransferase [Sulfuricella sp.]|uniref:SAM-dependent methyltransferase n=1 Tax=Sulfuricella sp. TaxID=2099377 RepID=UPI002C836F3F|nr:class I SAM-dependent methyltransferase [Sulfuricella sp.]HUX63232.1 class I SAM-dependent methyltransferase [Sulfuricella sp.]